MRGEGPLGGGGGGGAWDGGAAADGRGAFGQSAIKEARARVSGRCRWRWGAPPSSPREGKVSRGGLWAVPSRAHAGQPLRSPDCVHYFLIIARAHCSCAARLCVFFKVFPCRYFGGLSPLNFGH